MWKKWIVVLICFFGTIGVIQANNNETYTSSTLNASSKINVKNSDWLIPGMKYYLGRHEGNEIIFGALTKDGDSLWSLGIPTNQILSERWFTGFSTGSAYTGSLKYKDSTVVPKVISEINTNLSEEEKEFIIQQTSNPHNENYIFTPTPTDVADNGPMNLTSELRSSTFQSYWGLAETESLKYSNTSATAMRCVAKSGTITKLLGHNSFLLRPAAQIDTKNIVFAIKASADGEGYDDVKPKDVTATDANTVSTSDVMRIRKFSSSLNITFDGLYNHEKEVTNKITTGNMIHLKVNANSGVDHNVSIILFDETGTIPLYYKTVGNAIGDSYYALDTTGLPVGNYVIAAVNETKDTTNTSILSSSTISEGYHVAVVEPLTNLVHNHLLGDDINDLEKVYQATDTGYYATSSTSMIGTVSTENGVGGDTNDISYKIIESSRTSHSTDANKFQIAINSATNKPNLTSDNKPYIIPSLESDDDFLSPGVYQYRIQAYDLNYNPYLFNDSDNNITYPVDKDGNAITTNISVDYGLISDDITTVVYPSADMIEFTEKLNDMGTTETEDDKTFTENDLDENTVLATLVFSDTANLQALKNDNYSIDSITIKEKGKDTVIENFYFEEDGSDMNTYYLKWNSTKDVLTGKTDLDIYVNYTDGSSPSGIVRKENLSITIDKTIDVQKLKWQNKPTLPQTYTDVSGKINKTGMNTSALTKSFVKDGSFYVQVANIENESELSNATIEYSLKDKSTSGVISVAANGKVSILGVSPEKADVKIQAKITKEGFMDTYVYLPVTIKQGEVTFAYVDENGDTLPMTDDKYSTKNITYGTHENVLQLYTSGNPDGTEVTYKLKDENIKDVIEIDSKTGEITILNATTSLQKNKVIIVATAHDPSGNYADVAIELPINIEKAKQEISLKETLINVVNGTGSISPEVITANISSNQGGVEVDNTDYVISIDSTKYSGIAWSEDGKEIKYEYVGDEGIDVIYQVTRVGNRNYENAETITGTIHILGKDEAMLEVSTLGKITYGDHFKIKSLQKDSSSTNVTYTFEVDDTSYVSEPTVNENEAEFNALKVTGKSTVTVTVTRTADGEIPLSKKVSVNILPKDIKIKINDQEKLKGEDNPSLTYQNFDTQLVSWNGTQDVIQAGDVKLSTTANATSAAGGYPITGDSAYLNKTYPNYSFTFTNGTLKVNEEVIEDNWYHLELDDGKNTSYTGKWTNKDVNIITDHDEYVNISKDQSTWNPNKITVNTEGKTEQSFWLKKDSGAITGEKKETILIDRTPPTLKSVSAKDSRNQLQILISNLSSGFFFRPNTTFEITTSDAKEKLEVSGTSSIDYKIYDHDKKLIKQDGLSVTNEKASITIQETTGTYQLCMILKDQAGNETDELCKTVDLKEIGQDSDGDGIPDINIDTDGDGKPDLNITKKQCDDLDEDKECKLPYLNIDTVVSPEDTKGNGNPDMNIDTNGDGKPDLNTGIVKEWKPDTLVDLDGDGKPDYKTDSTLKGLNNIDTDGDQHPDLNIDQNLDGIPEININTDGKLDKPQTNIDGNGDGKPNINIDENGDGNPEKNVMDILEWKPEHNVTQDGKVIYDTMKIEYKAVEELEDNGIKVKPSDPDTSFLPNMALKVDDITSNTSEDTKKDILKDSGETNKEVKKVYDVKLLEDNKEIQPNGSLKVSIPVDETIQNAKVMMKAKDGTWKVMDVKVENGYYVFETDYIGEVSVIGDPETTDVKEPEPTPVPTPSNNNTQTNTSKPSVQGSYTRNTGGASTGDQSNIVLYNMLVIISLGMILSIVIKRNIDKKYN